MATATIVVTESTKVNDANSATVNNNNSKSTNGASSSCAAYDIKSSTHSRRQSLDRRPSFLRLPSDTYGAQSSLPRLPIPSLDETLAKFPRMVEALQTKEEQEETRRVVEEFRYADGPRLQQMLIDYDQEGARLGTFGSYVEEFWNDSYLAPDSSVVLNLNPYFILEKGPDRKIANNQIQRAAGLVFASLKMASMLKRESLPPDTFKGRPLCMDQFKVLFGTTRIPGGKGVKDHVEHYPDSTHVVVLIRNKIYYFQALWPHDFSVAVDQHDIKDILEAIQKHADATRTGAGTNGNKTKDDESKFVVNGKNSGEIPVNSCDEALGVLTSLPRREWAEARKMILESGNEENKSALHVIDSALFVLVLDDNVPKDMNDAAANMLHGTHELALDQKTNMLVQVGSCCNRWYDKLQLIVMANGKAGVNFEHSAIDGHTALRYASDVYAENVVQFAQSITALIYGNGWIPDNMYAKVDRVATSISSACNRAHHVGEEPHPTLDVFPKKLAFHLPPKVKEFIRFAETNLGDQIIASDTEVLEFFGYGKKLIVENNLSPDSVVQMCIMLAYYSLYGKFVCAYEPVLTKAFYHGRTEAMRGATPEAKKLCEIWCNSQASKADKLEALRVATKEHSRMVRDCANGKGVDRHLFALKCIAERNNVPMPALFQSAAWKTLNHTVLSTSNCGNPSLRLFGFGPVVQDGFGIGYIIKDKDIQFSVSSKHRQTKRYVNMLENTLLELKRLLKSSSSVVCSGHHNHIIHPDRHAGERDYGDFWGESVIEATQQKDAHKKASAKVEEPDSGRLFINVVRMNSLQLNDIKKIGLRLSFDDDVGSASSGASDENGARHRRESSNSNDSETN